VDDEELLSFDKDDIIIIKEKYEDGWFFGQCEGREGMFPAELVRALSFPANWPLVVPQVLTFCWCADTTPTKSGGDVDGSAQIQRNHSPKHQNRTEGTPACNAQVCQACRYEPD
jgi:hypothetical protein